MGPKELASALPRVLVGALLNQGKLWLGEDGLAALDAALSSPDGSFLESLRGWVRSEDAKQQLAAVAKRAEEYVREHCQDSELQQVFPLRFATLPSVQEALAELPRRLDGEAVRQALAAAIGGDFPNLRKEQVEKASDCYARALDHALLGHEDLALMVIGRAVFEIRAQQNEEFARVNEKLDEVLSLLSQGQIPDEADLAVLRQALVENYLLIGGDVKNSIVIVGSNNTVQINGQLLQLLSKKVTLPGDLPPGSYLPLARNAIFTGREEELAELARFLLENGENAVVRQAIAGMGGVGKTQLAVEFAYRYGHRFAGVHWLDMSAPERLDEQIARNGLEMGLTPWPEKQPEQVAATLKAWRRSGPRLLILDNYESPKSASEILGRLSGAELRLLITTRNRDWHPGLDLKELVLDEFSPEESLAFLRRWLPEERASDGELARLAERLGHLPLALELTGRYLNRLKNKTVEGYLNELENALEHRSMRGWKPELGSPTNHDLSLQQTFALSWQEVKSEAARQVLMAAGYCAPSEPLPLEALEDVAGSADELDEALTDLVGLGLLKEGDPPAIHPLVAEFARGLDEDGEVLAALADGLTDLAVRLNDKQDQAGDYTRFTPLVPHVRAVAAAMEGGKIADKKVAAAATRLWKSLGYHLHYVADYEGARAAFERALKIDEVVYGPDHPKVATDVNNLGSVLQALGDLKGAKAAYERALRIWKKVYGPEHPQVATGENNLGRALHDLGDLNGARAAFERALKINEAAYGPDHPNVARDVNNLGGILQDLGDLEGARAAFERALEILEAQLGKDHPNVATLVNNLGSILHDLGDLKGAKAAYERALRIWKKVYGPEHPQVATGENNLGSVLQDLGDLEGARAAFERALTIDEVVYGPDHPAVARDVNNLGSVLQDLGDLEGARDAYEQARKIDEAVYGPDHPNVAIRVNNLGSALKALGDLEGARDAYERALIIDEAVYGPDHPAVAHDVNNLGSVLQALGDLKGARVAFERALAIFEKFLPPDHPYIKIARNNLQSLDNNEAE